MNQRAPIRVGMLGAGKISGMHARALKTIPGIEIAAVCDTERRKAEALCRRWDIAGAFDALPEMLRSCRLDAVQILLPPALHCAAALECMEAGCHVFIEKPMAIKAAECRVLRCTAKRSGRTIGVNHNGPFFPVLLRLADLVRSCRLGAVEHLMVGFKQPLPQPGAGLHGHWVFEEPGNLVLELGPHPLSWIRALLGVVRQASAAVSGRTTLATGKPFYDTWQISMLCERGTAQLFLAVGERFPDAFVMAFGQDATAVADLKSGSLCINGKGRFMPAADNFLAGASNAARLVRDGAVNLKDYAAGMFAPRPLGDHYFYSMRASMAEFYDALRLHRPPATGIDAGADIVDACEAIIQSANRFRAETEVDEYELAAMR